MLCSRKLGIRGLAIPENRSRNVKICQLWRITGRYTQAVMSGSIISGSRVLG